MIPYILLSLFSPLMAAVHVPPSQHMSLHCGRLLKNGLLIRLTSLNTLILGQSRSSRQKIGFDLPTITASSYSIVIASLVNTIDNPTRHLLDHSAVKLKLMLHFKSVPRALDKSVSYTAGRINVHRSAIPGAPCTFFSWQVSRTCIAYGVARR